MSGTPTNPLGILSSASYLIILVFVGGPIWWKTTEVYRVSLPYEDMEQGGATVKSRVDLLLVTDDADQRHQWGPSIQKLLEDSSVYTFSLSSRVPTAEESRVAAKSASLDALDAALAPLHRNVLPGTVILFQAPPEKVPGGLGLGHHRAVYFSEGTTPEKLVSLVRETVLGEASLVKMLSTLKSPRHDRDRDELRRVTASEGYDILFSLLVPEPDKILARWDVERAVEQHVEPFLEAMGNFSSFSVKSQVLYLKKLNLKAKKTGDGFSVDQKELGLAINPIESQLASHVSSRPRLNFLTFIPSLDQTPLYITSQGKSDTPSGGGSNAFLIPRWGGVLIYNAKEASRKEFLKTKAPVSEDLDMELVLGVFLAQFRELLGLAPPPAGVAAVPLDGGARALRVWERDFLVRLRTMENLELTRLTLQSLAHLLSQISNIVINDAIGDEVRGAVGAREAAERHVSVGRMDEAFEASKAAFAASETAFFDPSLLALLYFPEDQKYAIYIPLFLPVFIPVIMSLKTIWRFVKAKED